jgi:hypothetical protein
MTNSNDFTTTAATTSDQRIIGTAAGVPFIAVPPSTRRPDAPVVAVWHLLDPPATEVAMAAALPLGGVDAWRIYFGLPLTGARLPECGFDELMRRGYEDAVRLLHGPTVTGAAEEFPAAYAELTERLGFGDGPLALVGGSAGAGVAGLVLVEGRIPVSAAVLISPMVDLRLAVAAAERRFGVTYAWTPEAEAIADRLDIAARADAITDTHGQPAILSILGADDDIEFHDAAAGVRDALARSYADPNRLALEVVAGMGHAFAEAPGIDAAPQTSDAVEVDRLARAWLRRHLPGG